MSDATIRIGMHETIAVVRETLPIGVHTITVHTAGNSVLSSAYVKSGSGTALVKWFDYHSSNGEESAARFDLAEHPVLSSGQKHRMLVTKIHNNARVEITVAGAPAEVMVLATLVSDFPVDLGAGKLDAATADLAQDEGLPVVVYDPDQGKFFLLRGPGGYIATDPEGPGDGFVLEDTQALAPGPEIALLSVSVPSGKVWRLRYAELVSRGYGRWRMTVDGVRVAGGITSPAHEHDRVALPSGLRAEEGQVVEVLYTYSHGPANLDVDAFVGATEI